MSGFVMCHSACIGCGQVFGYNPHAVPSMLVKGVREPICRTCVDVANPIRIKNGLAPIVVLPNAYEPIPEHEL